MSPIRWTTSPPRNEEEPEKCTKHSKQKAVAKFRDELTGTEVYACKRCRTYFESRKGWRREYD